MRTSSPAGAASRYGAALARRLWIALVIAVVVAAGAAILYARPSAPWRHAYVATQTLHIVTATGSATRTYDAYQARQEAQSLARDLASGAVFSSFAFQDAVVTTLATHHAALVSRFGPDVPASISASDVASALSATDSGENVTLSSHWSDAAGASAILSAAVSVLTSADDLRSLLPTAEVAQTPDSALAQPTESLMPAQRDTSATDAARQELFARIALGVLFGIASALLLAGLSLRAASVRVPDIAATTDATAAGKR